ncbi:alpha/beta hydrolase [Clostridium chauvoei]|uniref:BD-FAE-like domain-containing protein n=2 Tax=Clostridium chauvoei TaxID=46867 RepID=S6F0U8_9CLOT|nr:alpha/beta hydrolase [Clostridium chauvoei]ATD55499.1 lipase [Clostridium chauvoei]ATD56825.1 lipase [Clostridium chauvoei]MBX7280716.1 alpha/beta hydrolase fold domain-containing protein [Clostridium chauvoei]MBX7283199.1 alpha/beta hydrolase fold domain-containing protein [Clostridium chauvoei]MBX7285757.1 alpha/beta hydrolase fold domain-containing protein [Clostridium chauvoei]
MGKYRIEENLTMIPLMWRITKANLFCDKDIKYRDVKYGEHKRQYYRIFEGKDSKKPLIYFIHGGGWWHGSPKMCTCIGKYFNKLGYTVVLPAYRLVPLYKYPTQIEDVFKGFSDYINKNNSIKNGVIVMGFSAGGELTANLVFNKKMQKKYNIDSSLFKKMVSISGVLDFNKCTSKHSKTLIENYLGLNSNFNDKNPVDLIKNTTNTKVLCIHGDRDPLIDKENAYSFVDKINEFNGEGKVILLKGKHHSDMTGLLIGEGEKNSEKILEFINVDE